MIDLSPEICRKLRDARRAAKLGQVEVSAEVGCKQSALSMFEQGQPTKLSGEVVEKLARKFGISLTGSPNESEAGADALTPLTTSKGYCPNPHCPSNHSYEIEGRAYWQPERSAADPVGGRFCALCGEVLVKRCPHCGAPIHDGAVCSFCGEPYIA